MFVILLSIFLFNTEINEYTACTTAHAARKRACFRGFQGTKTYIQRAEELAFGGGQNVDLGRDGGLVENTSGKLAIDLLEEGKFTPEHKAKLTEYVKQATVVEDCKDILQKIKQKSDHGPYWTELKGIAEERLQSAEKAAELKERNRIAAKAIEAQKPTGEQLFLQRAKEKKFEQIDRDNKKTETENERAERKARTARNMAMFEKGIPKKKG